MVCWQSVDDIVPVVDVVADPVETTLPDIHQYPAADRYVHIQLHFNVQSVC